MKHHLKHLLMCSPMIVLAVVLIATGSSVAVLLPALACVLMMAAMMAAMAGPGRNRGGP